MSARQRRRSAIASHESGSTTRKKIAKVAVGKSTARRRAGHRAVTAASDADSTAAPGAPGHAQRPGRTGEPLHAGGEGLRHPLLGRQCLLEQVERLVAAAALLQEPGEGAIGGDEMLAGRVALARLDRELVELLCPLALPDLPEEI